MKEPTVLGCCAPLARPKLSDEQARNLGRIFNALADENRVKMLNILIVAGTDEVCVCDFENALALKQSLTSYHLKQLVDAGLVTRQRRGTFSYYRLVPGALDQVSALMAEPAPLV